MHTTTLRKVGGSVMLAVPPALLDVLQLSVGAKVGLALDNGRLVVEPKVRRRYTLDELLAQCDPAADAAPEDREWLDAKPVGNELLSWSVATFISSRSIHPATSSRARVRY
jgi:antitoxin ChpS